MAHEKANQNKANQSIIHAHSVQSAVMTLVALVVFCAACVAWFVNNTKVTSGGMQIQTQGSRFELASKNVSGANRDVAAPGLDSLFGLLESKNVAEEEYDITFGGETLGLYLTDDTNFKNNEEGIKLEPGDSGKITFYLHPLVEDVSVLYLDVALQGYIKEGLEENQMVTPLEDGGIASALLEGHVLLFQSFDADDDVKYSHWITGRLAAYPAADGSVVLQPADDTAPTNVEPRFAKEGFYEVSLYWVWPKYFRNYAYTDPSQGDLFNSTSNADYTAIIMDMNDNDSAKKYFYKPPENDDAAAPLTDRPVDEAISNNMGNESRNSCTQYYNEGDQYLGDHVRYALLQVTANE